MIEDMTHVATIDAYVREIEETVAKFNRQANGIVEKMSLTELRLKMNEELTELLRQQSRALKHMRGEKVEPETQFGEAVLIGIGATSL